MDKVLVKLYVPIIEEQYDVWIPINKKIYRVIKLLIKAIRDMSGGYYNPSNMPVLYDKETSQEYNVNSTVKEANIRNGTEIILI